MDHATPSPAERDQDSVWEYFQGDAAWIFDFAVPRLAHLFRIAARQARGRTLTVLNVGIGNGWLEGECSRAGWTAVGIDPSFRAARDLRQRQAAGAVGGIEALPFQDYAFDVVFCSEVLEHLSDELLVRGVREISRVLKPNGVLVGTVPFEEPLLMRQTICPRCNHVHHAYGHHQSFTAARLRSIFQIEGLNVQRISVRAFPGFKRRNLAGKIKSAIWVLVGRLGSQAADSKLVFVARRSLARSAGRDAVCTQKG